MARTEELQSAEETALAYAKFFETVSPENIDAVHGMISDDVHFIDPFNDVRGRDMVEKILHRMFHDVQQPKFQILDLAWSNGLCFMRWDFTCHQKRLGDWGVRGMTELHFDAQGRISAHYDYWDASTHFYTRIPVIGSMIRWVKKRASIS
ncbi:MULTISPECIES: nuclear transport factor 2 family protein [Pseudovibrio]|uniref:nuclear transport factor 2 family protein n=1 Tax=Stappiaceae TaxID=2821832 RepID=UPI002365C042|nr:MULTISPECIES: nuclear transport factor 2 family protein [Pseudovibrio]MDD7911038.1 nuclear transport factor 2 family protein [Pseudovibrio exalbescens]MDX5593239.1 nuclear transport factor 2 family protein [Pseudovibrio sp. SPO723]